MLAFAGSLRSQITLELRSRGILSCKRKSNAICCCRAYQSSGPVRYIPKNNSSSREDLSDSHLRKCEEKANYRSLDSRSLEAPLHEERLTNTTLSLDRRLQNQFSAAKTENLSSVFGDVVDFVDLEASSAHDLEFMDQSIMDECDQDDVEFNIPNENRATEMDIACAGKTKQDAENMAVEVLAKRAFTAVELRKKLHGKKFPLHIVDAVISDFKQRGFLNDYLYAESFSQSKWHSLSWGPRRIKQALLRKGVSEADVEKATKQVFEQDDSDGKGDMLVGMSKVSVDRLLAQASKQWLRGQDVPIETRKSRIARWLQYRGFTWQITNFILRKLASQYPP